MKTSQFFQLVSPHAEKLLRFRDHRNSLVHPSYHVSEVKAVYLETVDCGNMAHQWNETILQLWLSDDPDSERAMRVEKATNILAKVSQKIEIDPESELRIEYGNEEFPPVQFNIGDVIVSNDDVTVYLVPPTTSCKLEDRGGSCFRPSQEAEEESSCCGEGPSKCC